MAENQNAADQASTLNDERATRLAKRAALFEAGQNPYPEHSELEDYVADIEAKYAELADGEDTEDVVKIAGRVVAKRGQGKIMFIVVRDATAEIQLFCRINHAKLLLAYGFPVDKPGRKTGKRLFIPGRKSKLL